MTTPSQDAASVGWMPHLVRSALIELLQDFFGSADTLARTTTAQDYTWSATNSSTNITIEPSGKKTLKGTNNDAKIVIPPADTNFQRLAFDNDLVSESGDVEYRQPWSASPFSIQFLGSGEEIAWILAAEIGIQWRQNSRAFADYYDWKGFDVRGISAPEKIDEVTYMSVVSVVVVVPHACEIDTSSLPSSLADDYDI